MDKEYKFVSKFIEGKTYKELTDEEIEKLKSGIGVKKEDKEYIDSLEKAIQESEEKTNNEIVDSEQNIELLDSKNEIKEDEKVIVQKESNAKVEAGIEVIKAIGNVLKLKNGETVKLSKEKLKEKPFWRKGDVYYG